MGCELGAMGVCDVGRWGTMIGYTGYGKIIMAMAAMDGGRRWGEFDVGCELGAMGGCGA